MCFTWLINVKMLQNIMRHGKGNGQDTKYLEIQQKNLPDLEATKSSCLQSIWKRPVDMQEILWHTAFYVPLPWQKPPDFGWFPAYTRVGGEGRMCDAKSKGLNNWRKCLWDSSWGAWLSTYLIKLISLAYICSLRLLFSWHFSTLWGWCLHGADTNDFPKKAQAWLLSFIE